MVRQLYDLESVVLWGGIFARSGTPLAVIDKLHRAITRVLELPDVRAAIIDAGGKPIGNTPEEFVGIIRAEHARYGKLISDAGIRLD